MESLLAAIWNIHKRSRTHVPRRNIHAVPTRSLCRACVPNVNRGTKVFQVTARFQSLANCMAEGSPGTLLPWT